MQQFPFWQQQTPTQTLFPDIEWNRPEQRAHAGKLGIIGGNKPGFVAVGDAYATALDTGIGQVRVLLPDVLKKAVPPVITDVIFGASNPSGGLSRDAEIERRVHAEDLPVEPQRHVLERAGRRGPDRGNDGDRRKELAQ